MSPCATVGVVADPFNDSHLGPLAQRLADRLELPLTTMDDTDYDFHLVVTSDRLEIRQPPKGCGAHRSRPIYVDFSKLDTTSPAGRRTDQPLAKAVGVRRAAGKRLWVTDATAGLGADTWLLASWGCQVTAIERSPVIAALLNDGLARAKRLNPTIAKRIVSVTADARRVLLEAQARPDVVYIDTMFPPKRKQALMRKPLRVLRQIVGADTDACQLLDVALRVARRRVVVKRPCHCPALATSHCAAVSHRGKSLRYDVYTAASSRS